MGWLTLLGFRCLSRNLVHELLTSRFQPLHWCPVLTFHVFNHCTADTGPAPFRSGVHVAHQPVAAPVPTTLGNLESQDFPNVLPALPELLGTQQAEALASMEPAYYRMSQDTLPNLLFEGSEPGEEPVDFRIQEGSVGYFLEGVRVTNCPEEPCKKR